ncbi:MAG: ribosome maturation factor RimP [Bradymonadaceae bacterium]
MTDDSYRRQPTDRRGEDAEGSGEAPVAELTDELRDKILSWSREAAQAHGMGLFDVEPTAQGRWIIRVFVERLDADSEDDDGEGGVTVDTCAEISRYIEAYLDAEEGVPPNYVLEVSSPGLERPLEKPRHVERAVGERVQLVVREQIHGKNKIVGTLASFDEGVLRLEFEEREPGEVHWDDVKSARIKRKFDEL